MGIIIASTVKTLFKYNYKTILEHTRNDLDRWSKLPISLTRRINPVKMTILPKFLHLFQMIPIFLRKSFFAQTNCLISSFIWNESTTCMKKSSLERAKSKGGLRLPNFLLTCLSSIAGILTSFFFFYHIFPFSMYLGSRWSCARNSYSASLENIESEVFGFFGNRDNDGLLEARWVPIDWSNDMLKMSVKTSASWSAHTLRAQPGTPSGPGAFRVLILCSVIYW